MTDIKVKNTLKQAIKTYGVHSQLGMVIEEAAELIQAIRKANRAGIVTEWGFKSPSIESSMDEIKAYNDLCSEVADVKITLAQIELMLIPEFVQTSFDRKITRLQERINKVNGT